VRTPKFNIKGLKDSFKERKYLASRISWTTLFEGILALYFLGAIIIGLQLANTSFLLFHTLLMLGYGTIFYYTIRHLKYK
jgi:hypothetical protein